VQRGWTVCGVMEDRVLRFVSAEYDYRFWLYALEKFGIAPPKNAQKDCSEHMLDSVDPKFGIRFEQVGQNENPFHWLMDNREKKVVVVLKDGRVGAVHHCVMQCFDGSCKLVHVDVSGARIYQVGKWGGPLIKFRIRKNKRVPAVPRLQSKNLAVQSRTNSKEKKGEDGSPCKLVLSSNQAQGFTSAPLRL
jgi:hypothetical protein